ncbi:AAA family ATPase [Spirosoma jeollabukense]
MTLEDTKSQTSFKSGTLNFSCKESYVADNFQLTTPKDVLSNAKGEVNQQKMMRLQSLLGEARKQFIMNSFSLSYPAGIIGLDGKIESFSGLISISIKGTADRSLADIRTLLKRTPYVYLIKSNIEESGLYVWMQAEEIPVDEEHYQAYFNAALRLLRNEGITDSELSLADSNPLAPCWEAYDGEIWTDFYPIAKISLAFIPTNEPDTESKPNTFANSTDTILDALHAERQRAEEEQAQDEGEEPQSENSVNDPQNIGLLTIRSANGWIEEAKSKPIPKMLFDEFWLEGEICILFAEANQGKTILAVQICDSISRGKTIKGLRMEAQIQTVLYFDFELSSKQFEARYSEDFTNHHRWHDNFKRIEINPDVDIPDGNSFEDYLNESMEAAIQTTGAKVLVVDNITYLRSDTESAKDAGPLMKYLKTLKQKHGLSLLILAHCPKRDASRPLTRNDLQGSARLNQFADSMIALGASAKDSQLKYLKQVKVRSTAYKYDSDNVIVCQIVKQNSFLMLEQLRFSAELEHLKQPTEKDIANLPEQVQALKDQHKTQMQIADELGISQPKVSRILAKLAANK